MLVRGVGGRWGCLITRAGPCSCRRGDAAESPAGVMPGAGPAGL